MKEKCKSEHDWDVIVRDFSKFKGTIAEFCKIKGVSKSQLYSQRKARNAINNTRNTAGNISFTKIALKQDNEFCLDKTKTIQNNESELSNDCEKNLSTRDNSINIKIGKANIILDSKDKPTISFFIKELYLLC